MRFMFEIFHELNVYEVTVTGDKKTTCFSLFVFIFLVFCHPIFKDILRIFHLHSAKHSSKVDENQMPRENHLSPIKLNLALRQMTRVLLFKASLG